MAILSIENLTKTYTRDFFASLNVYRKTRTWQKKIEALKRLNLEVEEGEIFGLLGPNGAGKSTTLKILMGIIAPTSGSAHIMGKPLNDNSMKERIGFLPENPAFYDYLKGAEFLNFYGQLYGMSAAKRRRRIPRLLELVGIPYAAELPLKSYSKGMIQRIAMAQAVLNDPDIVFLDEPLSGLDPIGRKEVRDVILSLKENGKTVFFSSHILSDAEMICDRVGILLKGELANIGTLSELLSARTKEFEVTATGFDAAMKESLEKRAARSIVKADTVTWIFTCEEEASAAVKEITASAARLIAFTPRKESLEEYFIRQIEEK